MSKTLFEILVDQKNGDLNAAMDEMASIEAIHEEGTSLTHILKMYDIEPTDEVRRSFVEYMLHSSHIEEYQRLLDIQENG